MKQNGQKKRRLSYYSYPPTGARALKWKMVSVIPSLGKCLARVTILTFRLA